MAKPRVGIALLSFALAAFACVFLWYTYRTTLSDGSRLTRVLARVLADETDAMVSETFDALDELGTVLRSGTGGLIPDDVAMHERLLPMVRRLGVVKEIVVANQNGQVLYHSGAGPAASLMIDHEAIFAAAARQASRGVLWLRPLDKMSPGQPWIYLAKVLHGADGRIVGLAAAALDPDLLMTFHQALDYGERSVVALVDTERRLLLARIPPIPEALARPLPDGEVARALAGGRAGGVLHVNSALDGAKRLVVLQRLRTLPVVAVVGLDRGEILQSWYRQTVVAIVLVVFLVAGGVVVARRTGALERSTEALRISEHRFRELFERNPQPMWVYDLATTRFLEVNRRAVQVYGYGRDEFLSMTLGEILAPEELSRIAGAVIERQRGGHLDSEWRLRCKSGETMDVLSTSHDIDFEGRRGVLVATIDITAWRRAEAQLLQAQKMEAIGLLTGGIAHDFNNLLTVIIGNADKLQQRLPSGSLDQQLADMIRLAGDRAAHLTRDLLAVARRQALRPVAVDLNMLIDDMAELIRRTIGEDIELKVKLEPALWPVFLDRAQLESAMLNLAVNARDAMPKGGTLIIETGNIDVGEAAAAVDPGLRAGDYVVLSVSDTGTGMAPEVAERAFEPFFTTKEAGKGTGLGLAMVFGFVKQSNGHARIESEVGRGTTLRLYLPRRVAGHRPALPVDAEAPIAMGAGERLLLVEDNTMVRDFTLRQLRELGYVVEAVENGRLAIDRLRSASPYDLLVTDVVMPGGVGGGEVAAEATRLRPGIKVLYISGYTQNAILSHGRVEPGVNLLSKPFTRAQLAQAIRQALDADLPVSAGPA